MITYYKLYDKLNRSHIKRKELLKYFSPATLNKLRRNDTVTTETINRLCVILKCQPGDIMEFEPEPESAEE